MKKIIIAILSIAVAIIILKIVGIIIGLLFRALIIAAIAGLVYLGLNYATREN